MQETSVRTSSSIQWHQNCKYKRRDERTLFKKGTLFDDESNVVGKGTEPNLLIAKAAGLEAFIPNGDEASLQVEQIQEWVAVPEPRKKPLLGESSVQAIVGVDNLYLPQA